MGLRRRTSGLSASHLLSELGLGWAVHVCWGVTSPVAEGGVRLLPLSVVMLEPEIRTGREVAQKNGAEKENKWPERKPFVVRVGVGVGCACLLGG